LTLFIARVSNNRRFPDRDGFSIAILSMRRAVAGAGQNLRMVVKRPRLLFLALQREVTRLEGEHISAIARTTNEVGETPVQIIQLETDLRAVADELIDLQERRIAAQHAFK
jgi:hypothetical protein